MVQTALAIYGGVWLFLESLSFFTGYRPQVGLEHYYGLLAVCVLGAIWWRRPQSKVSARLSSGDSMVEVRVGDLFDQPGHKIIGTNDVFDTEIGEIIKASSVQGQFLTRVYDGDRARLDSDIEAAIAELGTNAVEAPGKKAGKRHRFPVGTSVALGDANERYFLTAYGMMGDDLKCVSDTDALWRSLSSTWGVVRRRGQGIEVSIPVVGSDLARIGLPRMALIKLIVLSFIGASRKEFVARKLTVVVHPNDIDAVNLYELADFLKTTCC